MKRKNVFRVLIILIPIILAVSGVLIAKCQSTQELDFPGSNEIIEVEMTLDDHIEAIVPERLQAICKAIILVESEGNTNAVSPGGHYVGILQIGKIYVRECNRIQDSIIFTYDDRFDSIKSLQMFAVYQNYHNPTHDINKAIKLHNPTAGTEYKAKVLRRL